jgi:hypothetical protein
MKLSELKQDDPRFRVIERMTHLWMNRETETIPSCLFPADAEDSDDSYLMLVDSNRRLCPNCGEEVEQGRKATPCEHGPDQDCNCRLLDISHGDDDVHTWDCQSCGHNDNVYPNKSWESLMLSGQRYGGYPAAHAYVFWISDDYLAKRVQEVAADCGFLVYEPGGFGGIILAVDGGGYSFVHDHWMPLYLALDLKWHEHEADWPDQ